MALEGQIEAFEVAAEVVDGKWDRAFVKAEEVRAGYRRLLGCRSQPSPASSNPSLRQLGTG